MDEIRDSHSLIIARRSCGKRGAIPPVLRGQRVRHAAGRPGDRQRGGRRGPLTVAQGLRALATRPPAASHARPDASRPSLSRPRGTRWADRVAEKTRRVSINPAPTHSPRASRKRSRRCTLTYSSCVRPSRAAPAPIGALVMLAQTPRHRRGVCRVPKPTNPIPSNLTSKLTNPLFKIDR